MSPTQRTMRALRDQGRVCAVVEKWQIIPGHPGGGVRKDLFGIIDVIALDPERGVVGVQCCGSDFAAHLRKMTIDKAQETTDWLETPGTVLELWSWSKVKVKRGGKAMVYRPRIKEIRLDDVLAAESEWKSIKGYECFYEVCNRGYVRSLGRVVEDQMGNGRTRKRKIDGRILSAGLDTHGYFQVQLYKNKNGGEMRLVHRLVAESFLQNLECKPEVNHIDGNTKNNAVENLEWCTSSENALHATRVLKKVRGFTKLNAMDAHRIRQLYDQGCMQKDIAKMYDIAISTVSNIVLGNRWKIDLETED